MADAQRSNTSPATARIAVASPTHLMIALAAGACRCRDLGDFAQAQGLIERALRIALVQPAMDAACLLWCEQAEVLAAWAERVPAGPQRAWLREQARESCLAAVALAGRCADPDWEVKLLLRASDALDRAGEHADAIGVQCHAMRRAARDDTPEPRPAAMLLM